MSDLVYLPSDVSQLTLKFLDKIKKGDFNKGLRFGVGDIDNYLNPVGPGELIIFLGRPGMGKSSAIAHYARLAAEACSVDTTGELGYPVIVTAEMAIEEYQIRETSYYTQIDSRSIRSGNTEEWDRVVRTVEQLPIISPIVYMGHSLMSTARRPVMTIENIWRGLEYLRDEKGIKPALVALDYLQRLKVDGRTRDRRMELSEVVEKSKDMALEFAVPVLLGSQAGRQVDEKMPPIPSLSDAKETGSVEETADAVLSFFRPSRIFDIGEIIPKTNNLVCEETLFYVSILKQRGGESGRGFWCYFDPRISKISDVELNNYDMNDY